MSFKQKNKKLLFGGSFAYYITKDENFFIKVCKGQREWIIKEFNNLVKYWNKLNVKNLQLTEPIKYSEEKEFLVTRFVKGKTLIEILDPNIYNDFGKKLKLFHENGFTHSHIEFQDILYDKKNNLFVIADVPFFNEKEIIHDLATIMISFYMYKLKRPWHWYTYKICFREFLRGYNLEDFSMLKKEYNRSLQGRIRYLIKRGKLNKIRGYLMILLKKARLI